MHKTIIFFAALAGVSVTLAMAQDSTPPAGNPPPPGGRAHPEGQRGHERPHPPHPLVDALDLNHDGVIDADEIAQAPESLKKLDKNGDGKITEDEIRPAHPAGPNGQDVPQNTTDPSSPNYTPPGSTAAAYGRGRSGGQTAPQNTTDPSSPNYTPPGSTAAPYNGRARQDGGQQHGGPGRPHPPSPIFEALDLNHDGVIDADEIAKASESLKKLDKNGDGKLTPDEYHPPHPGGKGAGPRDPGAGPRKGD